MDRWNAVFDHHYDHAVFGTGLAGCAAALQLGRQGKRVVLIGERGDIAWEWGRAHHPGAGDSDVAGWGNLVDGIRAVGGWRDTAAGPRIEGSLGELTVYEQLQTAGVDLAFMLWPVGLTRSDDGAISAVTLACKSGLRQISAARWIDASEAGTLVSLAGGDAPMVSERHWHYRWQAPDAQGDDLLVHDGGRARLGPGAVTTELDCELVTGADGRASDILDRWRDLPDAWRQELSGKLLSHASTVSLNRYAATDAPTLGAPNLSISVPGLLGTFADPAQRWAIGIAAATQSAEHDAAPLLDAPPSVDISCDTAQIEADVAVIGAGTGGAQAAIAAAENGARTMVVEPLDLPGGVGVNAGIHWYWWGVPGGLQQQIDEATHEWMLTLGIESDLRRLPWQPDVKGWVLDRRLTAAGVEQHYGSLCFAVETNERHVQTVSIATPTGPRRINATAWVDSSGDGDLCALAGARAVAGRQGDGRYHACTQSARQLVTTVEQKPDQDDGLPRMKVVNFDSGWVDPEDPADWTRARCEGLNAYVAVMHSDEPQRHTTIAPALGIRQSRQILTRQILTIDDVFARRDFPDAIGFAGCNVDNHSVDLAMEDDGFIFGRCILGHGGTGMPVVALPYGMVVPADLDNVWIGCRAAGLDQHAHYPIRQMRDIQRLGEACGVAAALAAQHSDGSVAIDELQQRLRASGALSRELMPAKPAVCGRSARSLKELGERNVDDDISTALKELPEGKARLGLWWMAQNIAAWRDQLLPHLESDNPDVSFITAATLAFGGDPAGAPRLLQAWRDREAGGGGIPHWYRAVCLIRCCAQPQHLATIAAELPTDSEVPVLHDVVTALLLVALRLRQRHEAAQDAALRMLDWARNVRTCCRNRPPQFNMVRVLESWVAGEPVDDIPYQAGQAKGVNANRHVAEDWGWQRRVLCARLAVTCDQDPTPDLAGLHDDERRFVRRAAAAVLQQLETNATPVLV